MSGRNRKHLSTKVRFGFAALDERELRQAVQRPITGAAVEPVRLA
jgi:hypothetical protein